jgi:hypothetical protein
MVTVSPEVIEKWRSEFEIWFCGEDSKTILKKDGAGNYTYIAAYSAWKAFIAGRQSLVIYLPKDDGTIAQDAYVIDAAAYIESQGYQVKRY